MSKYQLITNESDDEEEVSNLQLKSGHLRPEDQPDSPVMDPDLTIVLLGKTGAGKSASGNTILGRAEFKSKQSSRSVTTEISERTGSVFGKQISVVDTPGILDSKDTEKKIEDFCQDLLRSSRRCLFLVTLRVGRFTKEDQEALKTAMKVLGGRGLEKSYLLFTGGDALEETLEKFIFEEGDEAQLPNVVQMIDGRYHLFDNESDDEEQVRNLLLKSGHLKTEDPPDSPAGVSKEKRIVMLGLPGAGKSSSGNTILRSKKFVSAADFDSVSTETTSASATVEGCKVTVVDTPGFTDKHLTPEELYLQIMRSVVEASPGVHAFVIVVRVGRITEADIKLFELLPILFKGDALKYSMVLFTHGDDLKEGQSIEGLMKKNRCVSKLVSMCGGRYCVFDNRTKRSREQVRTFLSKIDEMVSANGGQHYTDQMFRMAETFLGEERNLSGASGGGEIKESAWKKLIHYIQNNKVVVVVAVVAVIAVIAAVAVVAVVAVGATGAAGAAGTAGAAGAEAAVAAAAAEAAAALATAATAAAAAEAAAAVGAAAAAAAAAAEAAAAVGAAAAVAAAAAAAAEAAVAVAAGAAAAAAAEAALVAVGAGAAAAAAAAAEAALVAAAVVATEAAAAAAAAAVAAAATAATAATATKAAVAVAVAVATVAVVAVAGTAAAVGGGGVGAAATEAAATEAAATEAAATEAAATEAAVGYMLNSNDKEKNE